MLVATKALADKAVSDAAAAKERVRQEDNTLKTNIEGLLVSTREALAKAPRGKGTKADLDLIAADLASVETSFQAAVADFNAGKFLVAKPKLEAAVNQLNRINADIEAAKAKASGKR